MSRNYLDSVGLGRFHFILDSLNSEIISVLSVLAFANDIIIAVI